jgi:hypothetical protein
MRATTTSNFQDRVQRVSETGDPQDMEDLATHFARTLDRLEDFSTMNHTSVQYRRLARRVRSSELHPTTEQAIVAMFLRAV